MIIKGDGGQNKVEEFRLALKVPYGVLFLLGALSLVACSPRDPQREKGNADRQAVLGVWSGGIPNESFGIVGYNPDGSFWASNTFGSGPSSRGLAITGTWNIINGLLVTTQQVVASWNWGTRRVPQFSGVDHCRIVGITDEELALALDDEELGIHMTNVLHKWSRGQSPQRSIKSSEVQGH